MTITFDPYTVAVYGLALLLLLFQIGMALGIRHYANMTTIDEVFAQVRKYVMANNIDRAIKTCNASDDLAWAAPAAKALLVRANRSDEELREVFEVECGRIDAKAATAGMNTRRARWWGFSNGLLTICMIAALSPSWLMLVWAIVWFVLNGMSGTALVKMDKWPGLAKAELRALLALLLARRRGEMQRSHLREGEL